MREIKFRVWKEHSAQFEHFSYGDLLDFDSYEKQRLLDSKASAPMQYTGFKDDDNKECYDGDIIRSSFGIPGRVIESVVYFDKGMFMTRCVNNKIISPQICTLNEFIMHLGQFWIIGNIHENPELVAL